MPHAITHVVYTQSYKSLVSVNDSRKDKNNFDFMLKAARLWQIISEEKKS